MWILVDCHSLYGGFPLELKRTSPHRVGVQIAVDAVVSWAFRAAFRHNHDAFFRIPMTTSCASSTPISQRCASRIATAHEVGAPGGNV